MRPGDRLILAVLAIIIVLTALDAATGGAIAGRANAHLAGWAQALGGWLMRIGLFISPVLLLPLLTALMGRFLSVPAGAWNFERSLIGILDRITLTIGGAARWFALGLVVATAVIVKSLLSLAARSVAPRMVIFQRQDAPSAGTRSGAAWARQPKETSGSIWPMTWRGMKIGCGVAVILLIFIFIVVFYAASPCLSKYQ